LLPVSVGQKEYSPHEYHYSFWNKIIPMYKNSLRYISAGIDTNSPGIYNNKKCAKTYCIISHPFRGFSPRGFLIT